MATVVMPHSRSQLAIWIRSQELAPKVRTFGVARSAGTQTTWLSVWTSMAAALGLTMDSGAAGGRGDGSRGLGSRRGMSGLRGCGGRVRGETEERAASPTGSGEPVTNDEVASSRDHVVKRASQHQSRNGRKPRRQR